MDTFQSQVDGGLLRSQLNKIMAEVNKVTADASLSARTSEEAGQCIVEFTNFFLSVAERHGTTPHAILGQHVMTNVFIFVLESIVKPQLTAYCRVAEKHAAHALGETTTAHRQQQQAPLSSSSRAASSTGRRSALEARRRRLRGDIIRPFLQLFQSLHTSLAAEGEPLTAQHEDGAAHATRAQNLDAAAKDELRAQGQGGEGNASGAPRGGMPSEESSAAGGVWDAEGLSDDDDEDAVVAGELSRCLSQAPLLWKNASPLNILCNHALEVLESPWLVAVVGADYATLLLEVLRWAGYSRLVTPPYLVRLSSCLVGLLECVPLLTDLQHNDEDDDDGRTAAPNMALQAVPDGRVWVATPSADDGCVYAQLLARLYTLPQVTSAFPPSSAGRTAVAESSSSSSRGERDALALVRRLMDLVKVRHSAPTSDLRLEAYCVAALRQLCCRFPYDHPAVARAPIEVVRLLCNFFFVPHHTPRHDVWRLEAMVLITVVLSYSFSSFVGEQLWSDLHGGGSGALSSKYTTEAAAAAASSLPSPLHAEALTLLHQTVYPTMQRIFTQQRHEYSFTSRRELFSFPCSPLQEVFDFGAVVLYLCSATYPAYTQMVAAKEHTGDGSASVVAGEGRKRPREVEETTPSAQRGDDESNIQRRDPADRAAGGSLFATHPVQLLCTSLAQEFFQAAAPLPTSAGGAGSGGGGDGVASRRRGGSAAPVLRIRTAGLRTNAAAVQDVVSDRSLFLLHLFAQPCATLRCPPDVTDALVEEVLLPLSAAFGLRMEPLLLSTVRAIAPHCSTATQGFVFSLLAQRALPPRAFSAGVTGGVMTSSLREDPLSPSEPIYRVLTTLLQGRLCAGQRGAGSRVAEVTHLVLEEVNVVWETHLQAAVQQTSSQLHLVEQSLQQLCEPARQRQGENEEGSGEATGIAASVSGISAPAGVPPTYAPLFPPSLAIVLTRFALLVQLVRLQQLTLGHARSGDALGMLEVGCGLTFVLHAAAHGVFFCAAVPALRTHDIAAGTSAPAAAGGAAHDPFQAGRTRHGARDASLFFTTSSSATAAVSGSSFLSLFSSADFLAWLEVAEAYACAALWTHRAQQQQLDQSTQAQTHGNNISSGSDVRLCCLRGPLRAGVSRFLDCVCADARDAAADIKQCVPAVLYEATEGQWMLRMAPRRHRRHATHDASSTSARESEEVAAASGGHHDIPLPAVAVRDGDARLTIPLSFQTALALSAQAAATWLMRRARLLERLAAHTEVHMHGATATPLHASGRISGALLLSVQCVQFLHLLLRLQRAGLWNPPVEQIMPSSDVGERGAPPVAAGAGGTAAAAARVDLHILASSPHLFDNPASVMDQLSICGGGLLHYAVLWLCDHLAGQVRRLDVLSALPLWVALRTLYRDVGTVLLDPLMSCLEPRQTILRFTTAVSTACLKDGVEPLARWRPSNPNSREVSRTVGVALHLCMDTLRFVSVAVRRAGVAAYAAVPLVDAAGTRSVVQHLLTQQALSDATTSVSASGSEVLGDLEDALLPSQHPLMAQRYPFLPPLLPVLSALLRLLLSLGGCGGGDGGDEDAPHTAEASEAAGVADCRVVVRLLQVLFVRYRYHIGPALCTDLMGGALAEVERSRLLLPPSSVHTSVARGASLLYMQCGRLLEIWTAQLTDASRVDMPVCTPRWQCALLRAAFAVLVRCELAVAEVLGRFSFEFLSEATPFAVRRHAALHVGILFRTFSARRALVLHSLLTKARKGMLSPTPMPCLTSLLAVSEAVRAAPELRVNVLYTLLECWATRGFAQRGIVVECMTRLTRWAVEESTTGSAYGGNMGADALAPPIAAAPELTYTQLCTMHVRPILFLWLCEYRHPLSALPVACFGFPSLDSFVVAHMAVLLPLALMLHTASSEANTSLLPSSTTLRSAAAPAQPLRLEGSAANNSGAAQGDLFQQLLHIYTEKVLLAERGESKKTPAAPTASTLSTNTKEVAQLAPLCLVVQHVPHIVAQLLVIASSAPLPLFRGDASEFGEEECGGAAAHTNASPGCSRLPGHPQSRVSGRRGGGGCVAAGSGEGSAWCDAAQRSLYWLEALVNTCAHEALAQAGAQVWLHRSLSAEEAAVADVTASAGAALLSPSAAVDAAAVLLFYLRRVAVWPTRRPVFSVLLAAHVDTIFEDVARLHRTPEEPPLLVYGTAEQLQRVVAWVAAKVVTVPIACAHGTGATTTAEKRRAAGDHEGSAPADAPDEPAAATPSELGVWQARCLGLLVPPLLTGGAAAAVDGEEQVRGSSSGSGSGHGGVQSTDTSQDAASYDALSRLLLLGGATFLHSLLHVVYRSCTAPTSLEGVLRGPQQLSLLVGITTRWCTAHVLGDAAALRVVLTYLLHWLHPAAPLAARRLVCTALLHVWPVAVSGSSARASTRGEGARPGGLRACASMLSRVMEPLTLTSEVVASTWRSLCRSDDSLQSVEWLRRAATYGHAAQKVGSDTTKARSDNAAVAVPQVVDVDGVSAEVEAVQPAGDADAPTAALPPDLHSWSWCEYTLYRETCLAPLRRLGVSQSLSTLCALLHHLRCSDDDSPREVGGAGADAPLHTWDTMTATTGGASTSTLLPPPPPPFFFGVAAGVDRNRELLVRCIEVAGVWEREDAPVLVAMEVPAGAGTSSSRKASSGSQTEEERMAAVVRQAVLCAVALLYRWTVVYASRIPSYKPVDRTERRDAEAMAGGVADLLVDGEVGEEQALACFQLLRSLSMCLLQAGEAGLLADIAGAADVDSVSGGGAVGDAAAAGFVLSAEQLVATSLGEAYVQQLCELERLSHVRDALLAEVAGDALRAWLLCLQVSAQTPELGSQTRFDAAVMRLLCAACGECCKTPSHVTDTGDNAAAAPALDECVTHGAQLLARFAWAIRSAPSHYHAPSLRAPPPVSFARVHVTHDSVWRPLRLSPASLPPNESVFLCRFVAALGHTYGVFKKSILWNALLPLLYAEERRAGGAAYASSLPLPFSSTEKGLYESNTRTWSTSTMTTTLAAARWLTPLLLHVMCQRESDTQRALRQTWTELLDRHVVQQATRCPRSASLLLHALYTCHRVLMRSSRLRGLRGAAAPPSTTSSDETANSSSAAAMCWPSVFGAVPPLQDMQECYWLSDIPASRLAAAAVAVHEPYLALLFTQLSGESLFGPRTGAAALSGAAETTRTAVLLREGTVGSVPAPDPAASHVPFSVLFPFTVSEDYRAEGAEGRLQWDVTSGRSGGRARARQDAVRRQTLSFMQRVFAVYAAVQRQVDVDDVSGASATLPGMKGGGLVFSGERACDDSTNRSGGPTAVVDALSSNEIGSRRDPIQGSVVRYLPRAPAGGLGTGESDDLLNAAWVESVRDAEDEEAQQQYSGVSVGEGVARFSSPWQTALRRAAQMLDHGLASTAMDVLLSLDVRRQRSTLVEPQQHASSLSDDSAVNGARAEEATAQLSHSPDGLITGVRTQQRRSDGARAAAAPWTPHHEAHLRSLLAEAAWRCAQWAPSVSLLPFSPAAYVEGAAAANTTTTATNTAAVSHAALERLAQSPASPSPSFTAAVVAARGGFYEHLLSAFLALSGRTPLASLPHLRAAEAGLLLHLTPTSLPTVVVAAESLHDVRRCAEALDCAARGAAATVLSYSRRCAAVAVPLWLQSRKGANVASPRVRDVMAQMGRRSCLLLDSVRHALSHVYGCRENGYAFLLGATERALAFHNAAQAQRWLTDWERTAQLQQQHWAGGGGGSVDARAEEDFEADASVLPLLADQRRTDLALRRAQVAYALGRRTEALALLQPPLVSPSAAPLSLAASGFAASAPLEPRVVQQLMLWHTDLQLVPPSQLVRDAFLARAAAADATGACSFLLGRLCHALAAEIVRRLTSHEHRQLERSVERSRRLRAELEAQLRAATHATSTSREDTATNDKAAAAAPVPGTAMGDERIRLLRRRIREIGGEVRRLEEEWGVERFHYELYRRSAINAYSRFLQHFPAAHAGSSSTATAAGGSKKRGAPSPSAAPAVCCVPHDAEEDAVHAAFGLVELWLNAGVTEQGDTDVLQHVLDRAVERTPTAVLLPLAGQLTAQLGSPSDAHRLQFLVGRLAHDYPLHLVWPLLALRHGHTFGKSREVNVMHAVDEVKVKAAQALLDDLASENAASRTGTSNVARQVRHAQLLSAAYLELAFERSSGASVPDRRYTIKDDFLLLKRARNLVIPPPTALSPTLPAAADTLPHVVSHRPYYTTPGGVNVPKVLRCELSDGQVARQLLKSGDDLRQDALIEQIFSTANQLFQRQPATRPLRIRTFTIAPLAPAAGILQWVEDTLPLGEYVTGRFGGRGEDRSGAHERYFPGEPNTRECRLQLQEAPSANKTAVLLKLFESYTPALHYFFLETFTSAQAVVERQQTFTRSVAASSMVGYLVGLGDRHINNILLHQRTAEVVHIDLGFAFEQSRLIPVPELVPFRMTRNLIDGLGVRGTEGALRPCAEAALGLLRDRRDLLFTLLSSVTHDPLARWVIGGHPLNGGVEGASEGSESATAAQWQASARQPPAPRIKASTADAARTLARIDAKLHGYDGGDTLSVTTQVRKLMVEAQRVELLAQMFPGWSQWV